MLLKVDGLSVKPRLELHEYTLTPPEGDPWGDMKPKHLVPLSDADWPSDVKRKISDIFKAIGVEDPYRQKLVEPYAKAFGGKEDEGAYDFAKVDWEKVVDYFKWEASAWDRDSDVKTKAHDKLVKKIKAKYGGMFNHQIVYHDGKSW